MSFGPSVRNGVALGLGSIPSLQNAPPYASLNLRFNETTTLDPRITFTRATTGTYVDSAGVLQTAAIDGPRFDYNQTTLAPLGLLIEEARTNSLRNNTMQGAVAGSPGTLPTYWGGIGAGLGTLAQTIVGTGTQNGIEYIDIRYFGTASTTSFGVQLESSTQIVAAPAQVWSSSLWFAIIGGSTAGINSIVQTIVERNISGAYLTQINGVDLRSSGSTITRSSVVGTLGNALTARVVSAVLFSFTIGGTVDITFRIGLPQMELGSGATSVIKTTATALTRAGEVAQMTGANFTDWFNAAAGTFVANYDTVDLVSATVVVGASGSTADNRILLIHNPGAIRRAFVATANVTIFNVIGGVLGSATTGVLGKFAIAYAQANFGACANGGTVAEQLSGNIPAPGALVKFNFGTNLTDGQHLNGHICSVAYYPRRLANAELQALTV